MIEYINRKRYKKKCIQGEVNLPFNTKFLCDDTGMIFYNNRPVCYNTSQDAYDYFVRNNDGCGIKRGELIENILDLTRNDRAKDKEKRERAWEILWNDDYIRNKFKRVEHTDVWLWNFDFYNASILDLEQILNKIQNA